MGITVAKVTLWKGVGPVVQMETRRRERAAAELEGGSSLVTAGDAATGEFRCAECGYGVAVRSVLPECPMCRGRAWEDADVMRRRRTPPR
jgi:rubrerythrin